MPKKIIIKNHKNKNEYLLTENKMWVRNFCKNINPVDINSLISASEYSILVNNEIENQSSNISVLDQDTYWHRKVVVISDGFNFDKKQEILKNLPEDVCVIGTNNAINKLSKDSRINYYVVNNPYKDCMKYFPRNGMFPICIASTRTNPNFIKKYIHRGVVYYYTPVPDFRFSSVKKDVLFKIDDYRNPICAAIGLARKFYSEKVVLLCCDDTFENERPGAVLVEGNHYQYPQQKISNDFIDGNIYWLKNQEDFPVDVAYHSEAKVFEQAKYLKIEEILEFLH